MGAGAVRGAPGRRRALPGGGPSEYATAHRLLERLEDKGYVRREKVQGVYVFRAAVDREVVLGQQLETLVERMCGGSLQPLLSTLVKSKRLSPEELRELLEMVEKESHMRLIGFGGMLTESFVALMAITAACVLHPGIYFAMNAPAAVVGTSAAEAAQAISNWGFVITPEQITQTAHDIGESSILARAGGAPTLAVGMAQILGEAVGGKTMEAFWYHFAILFEALFILTAVDAGTRVGRFMIQDMLGHLYKPLGDTEFLPANVLGTAACVGLWGYFLYQGVVDPLGGINTLWQLFGVGNQMLAGIALLLCTSVLVKMKRERYVWITLVPTAWLLVTTLTAGVQKVFSSDPKVGFIALARKFSDAAASGTLLAPAKSLEEMRRVAFNNYLDAVICAAFVLLVLAMCVFAVQVCLRALRQSQPTALEIPPSPGKEALA